MLCKIPNTDYPEYIKLYFTVDEQTQQVHLHHKIKQQNQFAGVLHDKPPLEPFDVDIGWLDCDTILLDMARTTPKFAESANNVLQHITDPPQQIGNYTTQGMSFVGEAIINFAIAMAVASKFPHENSDNMQRIASIYKCNKYLAAMSVATGFSKYLTTDEVKYTNLARSWKAFIGALYLSNGPEKLPDIFNLIHKEVLKTKSHWFRSHFVFDEWMIAATLIANLLIGMLMGAILVVY